MSSDEVPDAVKRLIAEHIDTIPELEAILLLRQCRERDWSAAEAGQRLYVSAAVGSHILSVLAERGFLSRQDQRFRYQPATRELESVVDHLAETYARQLVSVTRLVHGKPSASVRQFADAFRFRKEK
jgi:hypothetical protein